MFGQTTKRHNPSAPNVKAAEVERIAMRKNPSKRPKVNNVPPKDTRSNNTASKRGGSRKRSRKRVRRR